MRAWLTRMEAVGEVGVGLNATTGAHVPEVRHQKDENDLNAIQNGEQNDD